MSEFNISIPGGKSKRLKTGGKYCPADILVTAEGGGHVPVVEKDVNFYDYDGTLLYSYTLAEAQALTELPPAPTPKKDFLMFQEWNWTLDEIKEIGEGIDVGATYTTVDGKSRFVVEVVSVAAATVQLNYRGGANIDWGDGTTDTTAGANQYTAQHLTHTYSNVGVYTITMEHLTGNKTICDPDNNIPAIGDNATINQHLIEAYLGDGRFGTWNVFRTCRNLRYATLPYIENANTTMGSTTFYQCYSLKAFVLPRQKIKVDGNTFFRCETIEALCINRAVQTIGASGTAECRALRRLFVAPEITSYEQSMFQFHKHSKFIVKEGVTAIAASAFYDNNCLKLLKFLPTTPPTVANANAFGGFPATCVVEVPAASLETYKAATNYSGIAAQMVGV